MLEKQTNKTLCSMIAKATKTRANANDWNLKLTMQYGHTTLHLNGYVIFFLSFSLWHRGFASDRSPTHDPSHRF